MARLEHGPDVGQAYNGTEVYCVKREIGCTGWDILGRFERRQK